MKMSHHSRTLPKVDIYSKQKRTVLQIVVKVRLQSKYISWADIPCSWYPPLLLLCLQTPHVLVLRPRSLHLRPLTLRMTLPMTPQNLWVLHTGSESTKHSTRKPIH